MDRLPLVEHGDPCEETTLASIGKPLLDHLDGSNAIEALPVGNRLLHQLERIISHTVIVDQVVAAVNGLGRKSLNPPVVSTIPGIKSGSTIGMGITGFMSLAAASFFERNRAIHLPPSLNDSVA